MSLAEGSAEVPISILQDTSVAQSFLQRSSICPPLFLPVGDSSWLGMNESLIWFPSTRFTHSETWFLAKLQRV